jgi:hypothetical protein
MRTTRRAEDRARVCGESGGNRVWKDFMRRVRCGGVVGDGAGKEASTSCIQLSNGKAGNFTELAHQRRAQIFHAYTTGPPRCVQDVFHEAVSLDSEAKRRTGGKPNYAQRWGDRGEGEGKQVGDLQCGRKGEVVF